MKTLAERIRFLLDSTDPPTKGKRLADYCKISPPSVSDWLSGKTKKLEGSNLLGVSEFFDCNQIWLATGKGKPFIANQNRDAQKFQAENNLKIESQLSILEKEALSVFRSLPNDAERHYFIDNMKLKVNAKLHGKGYTASNSNQEAA